MHNSYIRNKVKTLDKISLNIRPVELESTFSAWKAVALPLNYGRLYLCMLYIIIITY